jgi:hypothetical protein
MTGKEGRSEFWSMGPEVAISPSSPRRGNERGSYRRSIRDS